MKKKALCALFMGAALAISGCGTDDISLSSSVESETAPSSDEETADYILFDASDLFSDRDFEVGYDEEESVLIQLNGDSVSCDSDAVRITDSTVTISDEGAYILSGTLDDGMIIVDAEKTDKVQLVLNGASIHSETSAPVYILQADKVFLTLASDSENTLSNGGTFEAIDDNNIDAVIFSKDDLAMNGSGTLTITSPAGHGVVSKDELTITSGTYQITAASHGLSGKDCVCIANASFTIEAGKDGIHAENTDDASLGFIYIQNGSFTIAADGDGMDASYCLQVEDGTFDITSGGSGNADDQQPGAMGDSGKDWGKGNAGDGASDEGGFGKGDFDENASGEDDSADRDHEKGEAGDDASGDRELKKGGRMNDQDASDDQTLPDDIDPEMNVDPSENMPDRTSGGGETSDIDPDFSQDSPDMEGKAPVESETDKSEASDTADDAGKPDSAGAADAADSPDTTDTADPADKTDNTDVADSAGTTGDANTTGNADAAGNADTTDNKDTTDAVDTEDSSTSTKGIKASTQIVINGGSFTIDSADDSVHSNGSIYVFGGTVQIASGDDGFHADETLSIEDGTIEITESYEGLEALNLSISGGDITLTATDDGLNAAGGTDESGFGGFRGNDQFGSSSGGSLTISGGTLNITASGDGIDSNGSLKVTGGDIAVCAPTQGDTSIIDYETTAAISGGTFIGTGASSMFQTFGDSAQAVISAKISSQEAGTQLTITDSSGNIVYSGTPELSYEAVIYSSPDITAGETYTVTTDSASTEVTAD